MPPEGKESGIRGGSGSFTQSRNVASNAKPRNQADYRHSSFSSQERLLGDAVFEVHAWLVSVLPRVIYKPFLF